uniref:Putative secreted peptide n=1 Tax=Anopheles braziliensis TaxID=58242 RepID=A0A2M3ZMD1_9DIPT
MWCLTVRLLVASTGTRTTELLRFAATRIGNQQRSVVLGENVLQFLARRFVDVLLVERHQRLRDGLADGVDLGDMTTTAHADTDVNTGELLLAQQQQRLLQLVAQDLRLNLIQRATVHTQQALSTLAVRNGGGRFLATENLDGADFFLAYFWHV